MDEGAWIQIVVRTAALLVMTYNAFDAVRDYAVRRDARSARETVTAIVLFIGSVAFFAGGLVLFNPSLLGFARIIGAITAGSFFVTALFIAITHVREGRRP